MCGRLVNLDTVARVLAEYYHLKTDTQLAALDEALSRVPAETVGKELFGNSEQLEKDHVADPGKMVGDSISRAAAIDKFEPWLKVDGYSEGELNMLKAVLYELRVMPPAQPETAKRIVGKSRDGMTLWYQCDMCNEPVDAKDNYCRGCGRRLTDG